MQRRVKDWIKEYVDHISTMSESPEQYHYWSAATVIGAAMKRHVWVGRGTYRLFPNNYTLLIGKPGIGKGAALNPAIDLLKASKAAHFMTGRITIEYVLEKLSAGFGGAMPGSQGQPTIGQESSLLLFSPEFNVFATASQHTFRILTDIWDSKEGEWDYGTRHSGSWKVKDPCVSLLAGCSSEALIELLPSAAIGGGFTRRVNFVYAADNDQLIPWPENVAFLHEGLIEDLKKISMLQGEFKWADETKQAFSDYYIKTRSTKEFQDEATASYDTTRWAHATKLAMIVSASRGNDLVIRKDHFAEACDRIDECSKTLKQVFRAVGDSDTAGVTDKVLRFVEMKGMCSREEILANNWRHVSNQTLDVVLTTLVAAGLLAENYIGTRILYQAI